MTKWWKNRFHKLVLQIWIYRVSENGKIFRVKYSGTWTVEGYRWDFLLRWDALMERRTMDIAIRIKVKVWVRIYCTAMNTDEHRRTPLNTETLVADLGWKERRLTDADGTAEWRRDSMVRSGRCSGRSWGRRRRPGGGGWAWELGRREEEDEVKDRKSVV